MAKAVRASVPSRAQKEKVTTAPAKAKSVAVSKKAVTPAAKAKAATSKKTVLEKTPAPKATVKAAATKKATASPKATAPKKAAKAVEKTAVKKSTAVAKTVAKPAKKAVAKKKAPVQKPAAKAKATPKAAAKVKEEVPVAPKVLQPVVPPSLPDGPIRVLVTQARPEGDKSPFYDLAKKYNLNLEFHPFIRVEGLTGKEFRRQRVDLKEYTAIVFTSRLAVDHFFRIMEEMKMKVNQDLKYFCITEAVALYLQKFILYRKRKVFFSADGSTQGLLDVIGKHKNEKYVVPMADSTKKEIPAFMAKLKIPHAEASLYRTVSNDLTPIAKNVYDMIVFFSPYSVQAMFDYEPTYKQNGTVIGAFGPTTTKAVEDAGLRLDIKAPAVNAPSMTSAMELFLADYAASKKEKKTSKK